MLFRKRARTIRRILIVEDEPLVAFDNEHTLRDAGFTVVAAVDTVADAVRAIGVGGIDLVLADLRLSDGGTGIEVAHVARDASVPLLFVSGACPEGAGAIAVGCLAKPYTARGLIDTIDAVAARLSGGTARRVPAGLTLYDGAAE